MFVSNGYDYIYSLNGVINVKQNPAYVIKLLDQIRNANVVNKI